MANNTFQETMVILKAEYYWVNVRFTLLLLPKSNASYLAIEQRNN
jgi:hypothetical protein